MSDMFPLAMAPQVLHNAEIMYVPAHSMSPTSFVPEAKRGVRAPNGLNKLRANFNAMRVIDKYDYTIS